MIVSRVRKVSNPRRKKAKANPKSRRRKLSAKQIKFFGTPRQKAALKRKRKSAAPKHRARTRKANPRKRTRRVRAVSRPRKTTARRKVVKIVVNKRRRRHARRKSNPGVAMLGFVNPHRPAKARRKRSKNTVAKRRTRRSIIIARPRRRARRASNPRHHRRHGRRNPVLGYSSKALIEMGGGVLAGVWATRLVPTLGPLASIAAGSTAAATGVSLASAVTVGILAAKIRPDFGKGVLLGGLAEAFTVFLDAFIPPVGSVIGLRGMGALTPGASFSIPQNPFYGNQPSGMAGLARPAARAYPGAY